MYLLDQTGTKLFKTEDCSDIMIVNDTEHIRKNRPDCKTNRFSIRAYRGTEKLPDSGAVIASYDGRCKGRISCHGGSNRRGHEGIFFLSDPACESCG